MQSPKIDNADLPEKKQELPHVSEAVLKDRRRFIEVYWQDLLEDTSADTITNRGDDIVYEGNALVDAIMFQTDDRRATVVFRLLYGLNPKEVLAYHRS